MEVPQTFFFSVLLIQLSSFCVAVLNNFISELSFEYCFLTARVVCVSSADDLVDHLNKTAIL